MRFLLTLLSFCVMAFTVILVLSNSEPLALDLDLLFDWRLEAATWVWVLFFVCIGFVWGAAFSWMQGHSKRNELKKTKLALKEAENELFAAKGGETKQSRALIAAARLNKS